LPEETIPPTPIPSDIRSLENLLTHPETFALAVRRAPPAGMKNASDA